MSNIEEEVNKILENCNKKKEYEKYVNECKNAGIVKCLSFNKFIKQEYVTNEIEIDTLQNWFDEKYQYYLEYLKSFEGKIDSTRIDEMANLGYLDKNKVGNLSVHILLMNMEIHIFILG